MRYQQTRSYRATVSAAIELTWHAGWAGNKGRIYASKSLAVGRKTSSSAAAEICLMRALRRGSSCCPGSRQPMVEHVGTFLVPIVIATHGPHAFGEHPTPCHGRFSCHDRLLLDMYAVNRQNDYVATIWKASLCRKEWQSCPLHPRMLLDMSLGTCRWALRAIETNPCHANMYLDKHILIYFIFSPGYKLYASPSDYTVCRRRQSFNACFTRTLERQNQTFSHAVTETINRVHLTMNRYP